MSIGAVLAPAATGRARASERATPPAAPIHKLVLAPGHQRLRPRPAVETALLASNGRAPAAPLDLQRGVPSRIEIENRTAYPMVMGWHGIRGQSPLGKDGFGPAIAPGERQIIDITPPDAGTALWRPILPGFAARLQDSGLGGMVIIRDADDPVVDLDHAVIIDDWLLTDAHRIAPFEAEAMMVMRASAGRLGNWMTVNGRPAPDQIALPPASRVRLRIASLCNARLMRVRFEGLRAFIIAVDGQPTDTFEPLQASVPLAPGSRYDVMIDLPDTVDQSGSVVAELGAGIPLVRFVATAPAQARATARTGPSRTGTPPERVPQRREIAALAPNPRLPAAIRLQDARRADIIVEGGAQRDGAGRISLEGVDPDRTWRLNGEAAGQGRGLLAGKGGSPGNGLPAPLVSARAGQPIVLSVHNRTAWSQVFHIHGQVVRLLHGLDDGWEPYWLDTVQIAPGQTARLALIVPQAGAWPITSTVLERYDSGLWGWIEVT